jgi:hypothetical protein
LSGTIGLLRVLIAENILEKSGAVTLLNVMRVRGGLPPEDI